MDCRGFPQLAVSGDNVYVIWQDNDGDDEIFFRKITNNGSTFAPALNLAARNLSNDAALSAQARIVASGANVHLVWVGIDPANSDADIFYRVSTNDGGGFTPALNSAARNLSNNADNTLSVMPELAVAGTNVYVVWQEDLDNSSTFDIFFRAGSTTVIPPFGVINNLSNNPGFVSQNPQVAAAGDNVFVTWEDNTDGDFDVFYRRSTDMGVNFDPDLASSPDNLSANAGNSDKPQISAPGGNKVYLSWEDNSGGDYDIIFLASTTTGDTFGSQRDLSSNSGASIVPRMDASGDNIYVAWQDDTLGGPTDTDIFFRSSADGGLTFSGRQDLSNDDGFAGFQQVSAGSTYVIWRDEGVTDTTTGEIMFRAGSGITDVAFDKEEYKLSDTATITVTNTPGAGSVSVIVSSNVDAGFTIVLPETDLGTGIYTGTITFTTDSSVPASGILKVETDSSILAIFDAQIGSASIFPRTVEFQFDSYSPSDGAVGRPPVRITVTDQNSNDFPGDIETIEVEVTSSTIEPSTILLTLTETSEDSGVFQNTNLIFTINGPIAVGDILTVSLLEDDPALMYTTNGIIDMIPVTVSSTTFPAGFDLTLTETDASSGLFTSQLTLDSTGPSGVNIIQVSGGDVLSIMYDGEFSNGLVNPNIDSTVGAIESAIGDTITATYLGESDTVTIVDSLGGGGGAGGISRAGFVVNVVAGLSAIGGGGGGNSPPSFGASSFAIISGGEEGFGGIINDNDAKTVEETKNIKVGEKAVLRFDYTEGGGIGKIEHIGLYMNILDGQKRQDSDAYIYYDPLKSPQVTIHDPNGRFSEVKVDLLPKDATNFVFKVEVTFEKTMPKSGFILEGWNTQKWSSINKIPNAIEVVSSGILQEQESEEPVVETFLEDVTDDQVIPVWVKSNAKWWSDDTIDNDTFISGIEYLVSEGVIKVSLQETTDNSISEVQPWIKNTAGWWADDMISEDEFITAIEWMITNNIIQVAA